MDRLIQPLDRGRDDAAVEFRRRIESLSPTLRVDRVRCNEGLQFLVTNIDSGQRCRVELRDCDWQDAEQWPGIVSAFSGRIEETLLPPSAEIHEVPPQ